MTYAKWIKENVPEAYGTCREVTKDMLKVFPHLRRVRGHYHCFSWGDREHWWLEDESGNVIDPTRMQFPSQGCGTYHELSDEPEPTGMCPNCGEYCYDGEQVHKHCHNEFVRSLG
jgi:hypothetical protein